MIRALIFLRLVSLRNLVVHRVTRLRQPKYLVGAVAAVAYFYYFVFRHMNLSGLNEIRGQGAQNAGSIAADLACTVLCAMALLRIAYTWIAPTENPGLAFSEAEISFLFPAPLTRRSLIHFRLVSSQFAILFSAAIITFLFNRGGFMGGNRVLRAVGWWVILSTVDLHLNATRLTLARLKQGGAGLLVWRIAGLAAIVAYAVAVVWAAYGAVASAGSVGTESFASVGRLLAVVSGSRAFWWLTLPFRVVIGPYAAVGYIGFVQAIVPALGLLALHYFWVVNTEASFEEGSIAMAEKRTAQRAALSSGEAAGRMSKPKPVSGPFPLSPSGPPEIAFLWKNLLSLRSSMFSRKTLISLVAVTLWACLALRPLAARHAATGGGGVISFLVLIVCGIVAGYTIVLGPQIARQDLRNDLPNADILKTYPLEGWRLALGELLAPTAILTAILWLTIIAAAAAVDPGGSMESLTPGVRATAVVCLGLIAPILCLIQLIVPNLSMVLMPAWYQASRTRSGGIEMFGQRLVFSIMQLVLAVVAFLPAVAWAGLVLFASAHALGLIIGILLATGAAAFILASEAAIGLWFLGERIERFDLSLDAR